MSKFRNHATEAFGTDSQGFLTAVPRHRFNYTLSMVLDNAFVVFTRVQDITLPSFSYDTQIVNQYNKKRVVQTKLNYGQLTVNFYDTVDSKFLNALRAYNSNYYNSGNGLEVFDDPNADADGNVLGDDVDTIMGFTPTGKRYFIPSIVVQQPVSSSQDSVTRSFILKNCLITSVNGDTLSYSDSNPVLWNVTFQPESIHITDTSSTDASLSQ